jgi:hypothetical protein
MWFKVLSFVIATALLGKATIALAIPARFYASRQRQYASSAMPTELMVPPAVVGAVTVVAWYATVFQYRPWGWVVTGFLTLLSCGSAVNLTRWRQHREAMLKVVANPRVWLIDYLLLLLGGAFAVLGVLVY